MAFSSSSFSSVILESKYDVFLSFRGEDTRNNFISHLYTALCQKKIQTFIDYDGLKRGDVISPALLKAIEESSISVVIFSEHYASSKWCLDELVKILECKAMNGQIVIPVFYHVIPSDVRNQTGSFEHALVKHEECFKGMIGKAKKWRNALTEAANLSGWVSTQIWPESKLVDEIVGDILKKLDATLAPSDCKGLVGIDSKVERVKSLLCISSSDFRVVGIWGMGGIGKTTLAEVVFNQIRGQFESCCFIGNVREKSQKNGDGLVRMKEQLLSEILGEVNLNIGTLNAITTSLKRKVQRTKFLVVLDDVSNSEQLKILGGGIDYFCPGSRVIITTRDKQVFCNYKEANIYEVTKLNHQQAFQLFSNYAFKQNPPLDDLMVLSNEIIGYANGNPLALRVLGSSQYNKDKQVWESALKKLRRIPNLEIHNSLRISYNLLDREEQNLFLDIACLFKGENRKVAIRILDGCYSGAYAGLDALIDKSLVTILISNQLGMHDLLQEMGRQIVQEEDLDDPGSRSRLWDPKDILHVLQKKSGTNKVKAILLDMSQIKDINLSQKVFAKMKNLKFLKFFNPWVLGDRTSTVHLPKGLKYLPDKLSYLHWDKYPSKSLASKFSAENLVELHLPCSQLEILWKGAKHTPKLRFINLSCSQHLTEIPNLSFAPQLQNIHLNYCESLRKFQGNIHFKSLKTLSLISCINLIEFPNISGHVEKLYLSGTGIKEVPTSICMLKDLKQLDLSYCLKLELFPEILETMERLEYLSLRGTAIKELPSSIGNLNGLKNLRLDGCNLLKLPEDICSLSLLETLHLKRNSFESLPTRLKQLSNLRKLYLSSCDKLHSIPELPLSLEYLKANDCKQLQSLTVPLSSLEELERFCLDGTSIRHLHLDYFNLMRIPKELCSISLLEWLSLERNSFESFPTRLKQLSNLKELYLSNCDKLQSIPELPFSLKYLEVDNCKQLQSLTVPPSSHEELERFCLYGTSILYLNLDYCNLLKLPQDLCSLSSLKYLSLRGNYFESLPTRLKQLSHLLELYLSNCDMLQSIPELPLSLSHLEANNCKQLQSLTVPPSSCLEELDVSYRYVETEFSFIDCINLNHPWTDLHRIQRYYHLKKSKIRLCFPGSEIPDWFSYRNSGSSTTIQLPQFWYDESFIGFAVCVVIAYDKIYDARFGSKRRFWELSYRFHFEKFLGARRMNHREKFYFEKCDSEGNDIHWISDHIMIMYDFSSMHFNKRMLKECPKAFVEIKLKTFLADNDATDCVKYWGVCPLYKKKGNMTSNIFTDKFAGANEDLVGRISKEWPKIRKFDNEGEAEPCPKRICGNQINAPSDHNHEEQ